MDQHSGLIPLCNSIMIKEYKFMEKTPIFFKKGNKKTLPECDRNFQCRYYEDCISEAAIKDVLLDCRSCAYQLTTSQEE